MFTDAHMEREITFDGTPVQDPSTTTPSGVARAESYGTEVLDALYYDTPDLDLLRRGATLRRRAGGHDAGWHLKIPDGQGGRREFSSPLAGPAPEEQVPEEMRQLSCAYARGGPLRPVAHLLTHRQRVVWLDERDRSLAELATDHVAARVLDGAGVAGAGARSAAVAQAGASGAAAELSTWDETEVELTGGDTDLLETASRELEEQGLSRAKQGVKLVRALGSVGVDVQPVRRRDVDGAGRAVAAVVSALREHADRLTLLDPAVRLDEDDAVHQMRVTARRLRSLLRGCGRLFDGGPADALAADLRWLGHTLGTYRDPEALRERLVPQTRDLPSDCAPHRAERKLRRTLDRRCRRAHQGLVDTLSSSRYFTLLHRLETFVADPPVREGKRQGSGRAARILRHEQRRTRRRFRKAARLPDGRARDEALHRARKAAKRTRYLAGALTPVLGAKAEKQERLHRKVHKRLGLHQDARTAEQVLAELAKAPGTDSTEAFAFGFLRARQRDDSPADVRVARRALRKAK